MAKQAMKKQLMAAVSENLYRKVSQMADKKKKSKGFLIRKALKQYLRDAKK